MDPQAKRRKTNTMNSKYVDSPAEPSKDSLQYFGCTTIQRIAELPYDVWYQIISRSDGKRANRLAKLRTTFRKIARNHEDNVTPQSA